MAAKKGSKKAAAPKPVVGEPDVPDYDESDPFADEYDTEDYGPSDNLMEELRETLDRMAEHQARIYELIDELEGSQ